MMKWSPWPAVGTKKFKVKVRPIKLEGFDYGAGEFDSGEMILAIKMKWKGEPRFRLVPFYRRQSKQRIELEKIAETGEESESYDNLDDEEFENICEFSVISGSGNDQKFEPWDISFSVLCGEKRQPKGKLQRIGKAYMNIAEIAGKMGTQIERKLSINLHSGRVIKEAHLLVELNFIELRGPEDSVQSNGLVPELGSNRSGQTAQLESVKRMKLLSWSRRHLSIKPGKMREENSDEKISSCCGCINNDKVDAFSSVDSVSGSNQKRKVDETLSESKLKKEEGSWESKEVMSRDGQTKLKANVFFASFDQCSTKAAGESACTALVAVIAHWLLMNKTSMPTRSEFDNLIMEGSSVWRKLCENDDYTNNYPDKHFDLETVLHADVRPITISRDDSFVGFFSPEKFESLKGVMSFDDIWNDIKRISADHDQRIYIVSWNDHFFVLKVEADAYYIIDTLGERLFEGCNKAFVLRFDDSTTMCGTPSGDKGTDSKDEDEEIICKGKECCKEFIKRFLASIPLGELEAEEQKGAASYYALHNRLQIELNYSYLLSSSLTSSPFSNSSNSASCYSTD